MAKKILAIFLLTAIALQTFNRGLIIAGYYVNVYAKDCENKAKPQMHCNGHCQMMKKLKTEDRKDAQLPNRSGKFDEIISSKSFFAVCPVKSSSVLHHYSKYRSIKPCYQNNALFRPPGGRLIMVS